MENLQEKDHSYVSLFPFANNQTVPERKTVVRFPLQLANLSKDRDAKPPVFM